jgi:hypothetical protein
LIGKGNAAFLEILGRFWVWWGNVCPVFARLRASERRDAYLRVAGQPVIFRRICRNVVEVLQHNGLQHSIFFFDLLKNIE